jgi:hypothetical protein
MEPVRSFETPGTACQTAQPHIPEDWNCPCGKFLSWKKKLQILELWHSYFILSKTNISKSYSPCVPNCTSTYTKPHFQSWVHLNTFTIIEPSERCYYSKLGHHHGLDYERSGSNFSLRRNTLVIFSIIIYQVIFILSLKMYTNLSEHWTAPPSNKDRLTEEVSHRSNLDIFFFRS